MCTMYISFVYTKPKIIAMRKKLKFTNSFTNDKERTLYLVKSRRSVLHINHIIIET